MDKDILSALQANKTKTLAIIEPFDSAFAFHHSPSLIVTFPQPCAHRKVPGLYKKTVQETSVYGLWLRVNSLE